MEQASSPSHSSTTLSNGIYHHYFFSIIVVHCLLSSYSYLSCSVYNFSRSCSISLGDRVVLAGGDYTMSEVSVYDEAGFVADLPRLITGRYNHGCSYYDNRDGSRTYLVTGGYSLTRDLLSSTELLVEGGGAWLETAPLPSPRSHLAGTNIAGVVFMTGTVQDILPAKLDRGVVVRQDWW